MSPLIPINRTEVSDLMNAIFLPSGFTVQPYLVQPVVHFTYEYLEPSLRFRDKFEFSSAFSAVGVQTILGPLAGPSEYFWVMAAEVNHDDAVSRDTFLDIRNDPLAQWTTVVWRNGLAAGQSLPLDRPIIVPPGLQLRGRTTGIGVGNKVGLASFFLRLKLGEPHPRL